MLVLKNASTATKASLLATLSLKLKNLLSNGMIKKHFVLVLYSVTSKETQGVYETYLSNNLELILYILYFLKHNSLYIPNDSS